MELEKKKKKKRTKTMMTLSSGTSSSNSPENPRDESITISTCPTWKLYENPFYNSHQNHHHHHQNHHQNQSAYQQSQSNIAKNLQFLHLPLSARKLAASFWDLTFFKPVAMETELDSARAQIAELRSELECERKARRKTESTNKRLAKELAEERRGRESMQRMCEEMAREISSDKAEIARMRRDIEEERKMMRMSEVLREERVQMKLADAKIVLEEKLSELDQQLGSRRTASKVAPSLSGKFRQFVLGEKHSFSPASPSSASPPVCSDRHKSNNIRVDSMESMRSVYSGHHDHDHVVLSNKTLPLSSSTGYVDHHDSHDQIYQNKQYYGSSNNIDNIVNHIGGGIKSTSLPIFQRKLVSPETENPHIKRGIKGFVEFPRVVRAIGNKNRQWGTKLECQKAQLRILLKQKSPIRSSNNNLIVS